MNRIARPFLIVLAAIYFLVDAIFAAIACPLSRWLSRRQILTRLRTWIRSLRPWPALALFLVPVILLEPVKPVAAWLAANRHLMMSIVVLAIGELLKLVLVERLFDLNRDKLLSIPAFAWGYGKYRMVRERLESTEAWQMVRRWSRLIRLTIRSKPAQLKASSALLAR